REVSARHLAGRAAAAVQCADGPDEHRRPTARAAGVRGALPRGHPPLLGSSPREVWYHRLGPDPRASWADLYFRPGRVGQLLHRELVPLARFQDCRHDAPMSDSGRRRVAPGARLAALVVALAALLLVALPGGAAASGFSSGDPS